MNGWFVVPAAGLGRRFGGPAPKQYQILAGKTVIEHCLERLLRLHVLGIVVVIHPDDRHWRELALSAHPQIHTVDGGRERVDSVGNGLKFLRPQLADDDWVLVHDVARPCVRSSDIHRLIDATSRTEVGGILATPVSDTLKRVDTDRILGTEDRARLWAAMTPQMFRYGLLCQALEQASREGHLVTDEAEAVERLGLAPIVVAGKRDNIKITHAEDLVLAEAILSWQHREKTPFQGGEEN